MTVNKITDHKKTNNKHEDKQNKLNKPNKKKIDSDLITVIFIISMILVVAVLFSLFSYKGDGNKLTGTKADIEREQEEKTEVIIITAGVSAVAIIALCVGYKIKSNRKKQRELEEKLRKQREIEDAIYRIQSKKNRSYMDESSQKSNSNQGRYHRRYDNMDDDMPYRDRGIRHKYDFNNMDLDDKYDIDEQEELERDIIEHFSGDYMEGSGLSNKHTLKKSITNKKYLIVGIGAIVAIIAMIALALIII